VNNFCQFKTDISSNFLKYFKIHDGSIGKMLHWDKHQHVYICNMPFIINAGILNDELRVSFDILEFAKYIGFTDNIQGSLKDFITQKYGNDACHFIEKINSVTHLKFEN
jgi:hypothetical protein